MPAWKAFRRSPSSAERKGSCRRMKIGWRIRKPPRNPNNPSEQVTSLFKFVCSGFGFRSFIAFVQCRPAHYPDSKNVEPTIVEIEHVGVNDRGQDVFQYDDQA